MTQSTSRSTTRLLLGAALVALGACHDDAEPLAPAAAATSVDMRAFTAAPTLLDALADAESRMAPALALDARAPMRAALAELRAALDAGQRARSAEAFGHARALLVESAAPPTDTTHAVDAADRAAIAMLLDVAAAATDSAARVPLAEQTRAPRP